MASSIFDPERPAVHCGECGALGPAAILWQVESSTNLLLPPQDIVLGRSGQSDLQLGTSAALSRQHARLHWRGDGFDLEDLSSTHGTFLNETPLVPGQAVRLAPGDRLRFGDVEFRYAALMFERASGSAVTHPERTLQLLGEMMSLDPAVVVPRALKLLCFVSGVERALLVGAGTDPHLEGVLTSIDDPELQVSRTFVRRALESGEKVASFVNADGDVMLSQSARDLDLRRIWVSPIRGGSGPAVAAVYLDSAAAGPAFDVATERTMDQIVDLVGLAMRNASVHHGARSLNEMLEREVFRRVQELEESRLRLVAQDHLAKLGRLVGSIAHEMNNPVGAIVSLSETLGTLGDPVVVEDAELGSLFATAEQTAAAGKFLRAVRQAGHDPLREPFPDTQARRALEEELASRLDAANVPGAAVVARRLARAGVDWETVVPAVPALRHAGDRLAILVERQHTFASGLQTITTSARQAARIVEGLKEYSHLDRARVEVTDLHRSIEVTLAVLSPRIPPGVRVETRFAPIEPFAHRPGELTQVWTNLVDNALQAMGDTGTLGIETRDEGEHVRVTITDTGSGVPPELGERIFELDVTTRGAGAGLGLGLAICKSLVESSGGGRIQFESRPGYTAFGVVLPKRPA